MSQLSRSWQRTLKPIQTSLKRFHRRLLTPAQWPWRYIAIGGGLLAAATIGGIEAERRRANKLAEPRVFRQGSPLLSIEGSLRTGDVLLFNRSVFDPGNASVNPIRMGIVMLQKVHGRCEYDHVGVIVVQNDYPYLLERGPNGVITLRPFDTRLLQSSSSEILLRRLNAPPLTADDEQRIEAWLEHVMSPSKCSSSFATSSTTSSERILSSGPRIHPFTLFRHLLASYLYSGFSTTSKPRSNGIANLGHLLEVSAQLRALDERMEELAAKLEPKELEGFSSAIGSTSPYQRLQVRRREVSQRFDGLLRQYRDTDASLFITNAASADDELHTVSDFPSAVLVVQTLQALGVLPDRRAGPMRLTDEMSVPAQKIPPGTAYPTRQFLSSSSLPLTYQPQRTTNTAPSNADAEVLSSMRDCFFDREMFLKSKNRSLPYVLEE